MESVIQYVIYNEFIEFNDLHKFLYINKSIHAITDDYIMVCCNQYSSGAMFKQPGVFKDKRLARDLIFCSVCDFELTYRYNPFTNEPTCRRCMRRLTIHKTKAKKMYKLNDADLSNLDHHCYHMTSYRLAYVYELKKVKYISTLKRIKKDKEELKKAKKITPRDIREKRIYDLLSENDVDGKDDVYYIMSYDPIYYYIKSGTLGIKKCKKIIENWKKFKDYLQKNEYTSKIINGINMNTYFDRFIEDNEHTISNIKACYDIIMLTRSKETELLNKLEEYGIEDEEEYKCEAYYDYISGAETNIDLTVLRIREYHFFMCYTNFLKIRIHHMNELCLYEDITQIKSILENLDNLDLVCKNIALLEKGEFEIPKFIKLKYLY